MRKPALLVVAILASHVALGLVHPTEPDSERAAAGVAPRVYSLQPGELAKQLMRRLEAQCSETCFGGTISSE